MTALLLNKNQTGSPNMSLLFVAPCFIYLMQFYLRDAARCCLCSRPWKPFTHSGRDSVRVFADLWKVTFSPVYFAPAPVAPLVPLAPVAPAPIKILPLSLCSWTRPCVFRCINQQGAKSSATRPDLNIYKRSSKQLWLSSHDVFSSSRLNEMTRV